MGYGSGGEGGGCSFVCTIEVTICLFYCVDDSLRLAVSYRKESIHLNYRFSKWALLCPPPPVVDVKRVLVDTSVQGNDGRVKGYIVRKSVDYGTHEFLL